jgi:hypothetical protein
MFVAALLDARPDLRARVFADVAAALPAGAGRPELSEGASGGIAACRFALVPGGRREHAAEHRHGARFADLTRRIASADLHPGTADHATAILRRLAESEARLHRVPVEEVHFHEIGGWDSLMDVVAAGSVAAALAPCAWSVSDLPRGQGLVRTQHGMLPVPAPATADILRGFRWRDDGVGGERVTPTGAAILAHLVNAASPPATGLVLEAVGIGAGDRDLEGMPNILRALVFSVASHAPASPAPNDSVMVLSFDIDDMTGEEIGVAAERLRAADGVLDLTLGSRQGKKGRPVHDFRLLVRPESLSAAIDACFHETSTIGLRWRREERRCLERSTDAIPVEGRVVRRKGAVRPGGRVSLKAESDDLAGFDGLVQRRRAKSRGEQGSGNS